MLIGLSGYARSGKDEVAKMIKKHDPLSCWQIERFSGPLKKVASILTGIEEGMWDSQEFKSSPLEREWGSYSYDVDLGTGRVVPLTAREFLQKLGTDAVRNNLHYNAWVNAAMAKYRNGFNWIFTDCRFSNEAAAIKERGGYVVRIYRTGVGPVNSHESEVSLDAHSFDYVINNTGTLDDLYIKVGKMMEDLCRKN